MSASTYEQKQAEKTKRLTLGALLLFFIPLGFSASLTSLSHVIINGTLARGNNADIIIASYAVAFSVFLIMERPVFLLRQTTSAMVRDRVSFRAMFGVTFYVVLGLLSFSLIVAYTPVGVWFFGTFFESDEALLETIIHTYRVLLIVSIFSAFRCLYQGLIINQLQTKWLTIGMIVRLTVMGSMAVFFVWTDMVHSAWIGALIFLSGMAIEFGISYWKARQLLREKFPQEDTNHEIKTKGQVFRFYSPLLLSGGLAVVILPTVNAMLGQTVHITQAIAAFALAMSINQMALSFFMYLHQVVLQFFRDHARDVIKWAALLAVIPGTLMAVFCYTPVGFWFLTTIMGTDAALSEATIYVLRFLMIKSVLLPWVDFCNGLLMLRRQTNVMILSQAVNVTFTITMLIILVQLVPHWNGMIGGLAVAVGVLGELIVVAYINLRGTDWRWRYQQRKKEQERQASL